jgi:hypothetical protein
VPDTIGSYVDAGSGFRCHSEGPAALGDARDDDGGTLRSDERVSGRVLVGGAGVPGLGIRGDEEFQDDGAFDWRAFQDLRRSVQRQEWNGVPRSGRTLRDLAACAPMTGMNIAPVEE